MTIAELREHVRRLTGLLDAPEPGLWTWHQAVVDTVHTICQAIEVRAGDTAERERRAPIERGEA